MESAIKSVASITSKYIFGDNQTPCQKPDCLLDTFLTDKIIKLKFNSRNVTDIWRGLRPNN
jgi:hypothetical protein